jgi:PAS domain S-box-containing protein
MNEVGGKQQLNKIRTGFLILFIVFGVFLLVQFLFTFLQEQKRSALNELTVLTQEQQIRTQELLDYSYRLAEDSQPIEAIKAAIAQTLVSLRDNHEQILATSQSYSLDAELIESLYYDPETALDDTARNYWYHAQSLLTADNYLSSNKDIQYLQENSQNILQKFSLLSVIIHEERQEVDRFLLSILALLTTVYLALLITMYLLLRPKFKNLFDRLGTSSHQLEHLSKKEHLVDEAVHANHQLIYHCSYETNQIEWIGDRKQLIGFDHEELLTKTTDQWGQFIDEEQREDILFDLKKAKETDSPYVLSYRFIRKDGGLIAVQDKGRFVKNSAGKVIGRIGSLVDISDFEYAMNVVQTTKEKLNHVFKHMSDAFVMLKIERDTSGVINDYIFLEFNDSFKQMVADSGELISSSASTIFPKMLDDSVPWSQMFEHALEGDEKQNEEVHSIAFNRWLRISVFSPQEEYVALIFSDITESKKNIELLKESEQQFRGAFQTSAIGMALVGNGGDWMEVNPALSEIVEYDAKELRELSYQDITHEDDLPLHQDFIQQVLDGKLNSYQLEQRFTTKSGKTVWVLINGSLVRDEKGEPKYFIAQIQDITERKLRDERIQELNTIKNRFINVISHQLRTPLTSISWNLESLVSGDLGDLEPQQLEFLRATKKASSDIIDRIADMVTALDIEEDKLRLTPEEVSVESLWAAVRSGLDDQIKVKRLQVTYNAPKSSLPNITADREKVTDVINHLVKNSIIFSHEEGKIVVDLSKSKSMIKFEIEDYGIGIPKGEQGRIFEKFYRGSNAFGAAPDHSGLGLFIAKHFVESHGGELGYSSKEGKGTTFWFTLPIHSKIM